jgi:plasmid stabilization system protein ParE
MTYAVRVTATALEEIDAALDWLVKRSAKAAARWHDRLLDAIQTLSSNPERCGLAPEADWYESGELRQMLYGKRHGVYRILFEVRGKTVYILRVRHTAQNLLGPDDF